MSSFVGHPVSKSRNLSKTSLKQTDHLKKGEEEEEEEKEVDPLLHLELDQQLPQDFHP